MMFCFWSEPTNDLDLDILMWREIFMNEYEGALFYIYVSHDETLLSELHLELFCWNKSIRKLKKCKTFNLQYRL